MIAAMLSRAPLIPFHHPQTGFPYRTDTAILCAGINYLADTKPDLFGGPDIIDLLRADIADYLARAPRKESPEKTPILPVLPDIFSGRNVTPFADIRLAFLGGEDYFDHSVFGADTKPLRESFAAFRDFHDHRNGNALTAARTNFIAENGKYDIVLSGNVLNYPVVPNVKSVFAACANILKPGGLAIHGVDYSSHHYDLLLSEKFHDVCGQQKLNPALPRYEMSRKVAIIDYLAFRQVEDVYLTDAMLMRLEKSRAIPRATDRLFLQATSRMPGHVFAA